MFRDSCSSCCCWLAPYIADSSTAFTAVGRRFRRYMCVHTVRVFCPRSDSPGWAMDNEQWTRAARWRAAGDATVSLQYVAMMICCYVAKLLCRSFACGSQYWEEPIGLVTPCTPSHPSCYRYCYRYLYPATLTLSPATPVTDESHSDHPPSATNEASERPPRPPPGR